MAQGPNPKNDLYKFNEAELRSKLQNPYYQDSRDDFWRQWNKYDNRQALTAENTKLDPAALYSGAKIGNMAMQGQTNIDTSQQQAGRNAQLGLLNQLQAASMGKGPSVADETFRQSSDRLNRQAQSLAGGLGLDGGLAARQLANQQATTGQGLAAQRSLGRIQEQLGAREQLGSAAGNMRAQDLGLATSQAGLDAQREAANANALNARTMRQADLFQQAGLSNQEAINANRALQAQMNQQTALANLQSALANRDANDKYGLEYRYGANTLDQQQIANFGQLAQFLRNIGLDNAQIQAGINQQESAGLAGILGGIMNLFGSILGGATKLSDKRQKRDISSGVPSFQDYIKSQMQSIGVPQLVLPTAPVNTPQLPSPTISQVQPVQPPIVFDPQAAAQTAAAIGGIGTDSAQLPVETKNPDDEKTKAEEERKDNERKAGISAAITGAGQGLGDMFKGIIQMGSNALDPAYLPRQQAVDFRVPVLSDERMKTDITPGGQATQNFMARINSFGQQPSGNTRRSTDLGGFTAGYNRAKTDFGNQAAPETPSLGAPQQSNEIAGLQKQIQELKSMLTQQQPQTNGNAGGDAGTITNGATPQPRFNPNSVARAPAFNMDNNLYAQSAAGPNYNFSPGEYTQPPPPSGIVGTLDDPRYQKLKAFRDSYVQDFGKRLPPGYSWLFTDPQRKLTENDITRLEAWINSPESNAERNVVGWPAVYDDTGKKLGYYSEQLGRVYWDPKSGNPPPLDYFPKGTQLIYQTGGIPGQAGGFAVILPQGVIPGRLQLSDERQKTNIKGAREMIDNLKAYTYDYKDPTMPGAAPGRQLGVMAQDLEKSEVGKQAVMEGPDGVKMVQPLKTILPMLAVQADMNERLKKLENKKG